MWNNWIGHRIRNRGRALVYRGLLLGVAAAAVAVAYRAHFAAGLAGPYHATADDLAAADAAAAIGRRPVVVRGDESEDTGAVIRHARRPDFVRARYVAVRAGERWLLAKVPAAHAGDTFEGVLTPVSVEEREGVVAPFARARGVDPQQFLPYELDATADVYRGPVAGLFFVIALLLPGLVLIGLGLRWQFRPETHPLARALVRFGPPAEVADNIVVAGQPLRLGPLEFADDWLVGRAPRSGYTAFRFDDLVWVHQTIETVNRTPLHRIKLYDRRGVTFTGRGRPDVIEAAVAAVTRKVPWVVVGWDERVAKQWRDDPASLVPRVEERRQELQARPPAADAT